MADTKMQKVYKHLFQRHQELHRDFSYVFGTPEGKRVLAYICEIGYVNKPTFNPKSPEKTVLNEGSRVLALAILKHTHKEPIQIVAESIIEGETYQ